MFKSELLVWQIDCQVSGVSKRRDKSIECACHLVGERDHLKKTCRVGRQRPVQMSLESHQISSMKLKVETTQKGKC